MSLAATLVRMACPPAIQQRLRCAYLVVKVRSGWAEREPEIAYLRNTLERNDVLFDIGANIGTYTVGLASTCEKIFSFEPILDNLMILRKVTANFANVTVMPFAVGEADGQRKMNIPSDGPGFRGLYRAHFSSHGTLVRARSIDSLVASGLPAPTFIKVDVEGFAGEVIRGARHLIRTHFPTWLIEATREDFDLMKGFGYRTFVYQKGIREVDKFTPDAVNHFFSAKNLARVLISPARSQSGSC